MAKDWNEFEEWHRLFDALCSARGHQANAALASEFCARSGKTSRADFESARKQLRAWRLGRRLPLKRNLSMLAQILDVEGDAGLQARWLELYRRARSSPGVEARGSIAATATRRRPFFRAALMAGAMLASGGGLQLYSQADERQRNLAQLPIVNFEGSVRVPLGASVLVHGHAGDCDDAPPDWTEMAVEMPSIPLGAFEDGGLARKVVRRCTSERLVRAVRFTARETGTGSVRLFGDYIRIDVVSAR